MKNFEIFVQILTKKCSKIFLPWRTKYFFWLGLRWGGGGGTLAPWLRHWTKLTSREMREMSVIYGIIKVPKCQSNHVRTFLSPLSSSFFLSHMVLIYSRS